MLMLRKLTAGVDGISRDAQRSNNYVVRTCALVLWVLGVAFAAFGLPHSMMVNSIYHV